MGVAFVRRPLYAHPEGLPHANARKNADGGTHGSYRQSPRPARQGEEKFSHVGIFSYLCNTMTRHYFCKPIRKGTCLLSMAAAALLLAGCHGGNRNLKVTERNLAGTWRYETFVNATNDTLPFTDHLFYLVLERNGTYVATEYDEGKFYEYDAGDWSVRGDTLLTVSDNIKANRIPLGVVERVKRNRMLLRYGDGHEYWGVTRLTRQDSVPAFRVAPQLLAGQWKLAWRITKDEQGEEHKQDLQGLWLTLGDDGTCLLLRNGQEERTTWRLHDDHTMECGERHVRLLLLTTNTCVLKTTVQQEVRFYGLTKMPPEP